VFVIGVETVVTVNLDGSVTIARPLTVDEYAMLTLPENWTWGPLVKALIDGHSRQ
jgi:hypothetical protein